MALLSRRLRHTRTLRRRLALLLTTALLLFLTLFHLLPYDSSIRLAVTFNTARFLNALRRSTSDRDAWLNKPALFPIDLRSDVGYLIKTGYGTRHRVPAQLKALEQSAGGGILGDEGRGFIVVGDWTTANETDAKLLGVQVHDAIKMMMETKIDKSLENHQRFLKYRTLQGTVDSGDEEQASRVGAKFGWELDALKFIMGMELAYKRMPHKKWYIILDDDTFLIRPSLELFLTHMDYSKPQYIGNAVGDYRARFGHGGSAVVVSGAAMKQLFDNQEVVSQAYVDSLDEKWGDRLVALTLQKLGIYIDERYSHHFNGETPELTRIANDRFCSPIISFHGLREPGAMEHVGYALRHAENPVLWGQLWEIFANSSMRDAGGGGGGGEGDEQVKDMQDYVGPTDERAVTWRRVRSAERCLSKCAGQGWCLAWTYDRANKDCHASPWVVIGEAQVRGKQSGINWQRVEPLLRGCS